jgi:hypothetical protein
MQRQDDVSLILHTAKQNDTKQQKEGPEYLIKLTDRVLFLSPLEHRQSNGMYVLHVASSISHVARHRIGLCLPGTKRRLRGAEEGLKKRTELTIIIICGVIRFFA